MIRPPLAGLALLLAATASATPVSNTPFAVVAVEGVTVPGLPPVSGRITVDQFGYLPDEDKTAVISDPQLGYNAAAAYEPGPELEVRRKDDGAVVHRGSPRPFAGGATDRASGDRGWWFDFTPVREAGDYYIFDPKNGRRSHVLRVAPDIYAPVLRAALRVFYYQREAFAHRPPYAEAPWIDEPTYLQDQQARALTAKADGGTARDLSGGWMDAGDTNKYPTFLAEVIHPLLYGWRANPAALGDDFGLPESGNGLPDVLDEIKWELDWLVKMQEADGGVFLKMGHDTYAGSTWPLSRDQRPRFYGPKASASTLAAAAIFAHASRVYREFPAWQDFAADLGERAERAWRWYQANPRSYDADHGEIKSGDADKDAAEHDRWEALAAMHLWAITGRAEYHGVFQQRYRSMRQFVDPVWAPYEAGQAEALLDYTHLPGANAEIVAHILARLRTSTHNPDFMPQDDSTDLYRSWIAPTAFHWGSNLIRSGYGIVAVNALTSVPEGIDRSRVRQRALDMLHGLHGVNPLGLVYLANMSGAGAEVSAMRLYHEWFSAGSPLAEQPAPGYVTGGPNHSYGGTIEWLKHQPDAKCYADFNRAHPEQSWELSEPALYYQAMYVRLLVNFVPGRTDR